jgi:hypothetical protein
MFIIKLLSTKEMTNFSFEEVKNPNFLFGIESDADWEVICGIGCI